MIAMTEKKEETEKDTYLTAAEVGKLLKMHPETVKRHMRNGVLPGKKIGGEWRVHKDDFEAHMRNK